LTLVGLGVAGAIIGGLIGRHLGKTIGMLQKDISLLDRRIIELEVKALGSPPMETVKQREAYAAIVVQLLSDRVRQYQRVLPTGGNEKIHTLRTQFIDGEITTDAFTNGLLFDIYSSAK
jgi:hypothetical protein